MLTIIEGPDGAGKSTLARELSELGLGTVLHQGPFRGNPFRETIATLHGRLESGQNVIWDRSHLGEQVYGPIFRGCDALGQAKRRMLDRWLLAHEAVVVLCYPRYEVARANWERRRAEGTELFTDRYEELYRAWSDLETALPLVVNSYEVLGAEDLLGTLRLMRSRENEGPGIGAWCPGVTLLVGDRPSSSLAEELPPLPFVNDAGCSPWLAEQLEDACVSERRLYWVNAYRGDGTPVDLSFTERLQPGKVIALGNAASDALKQHGIFHHKVRHPQYWKRFHHYGETYPLIDELTRERGERIEL